MQYKITKGIHNNYLIEGSSVASESDLLASLKCLRNLEWKKDKIFIFLDSDSNPLITHDFLSSLANQISESNISNYTIISLHNAKNPRTIGSEIKYEDSASDFIDRFKMEPIEDAMIMIIDTNEGQAKVFLDFLSHDIADTSMEVNLDALSHNLNYYKGSIAPSTKIMAMVKASGYGHGMVEVAHHLKNKVEYFGVAYLNEGINLRKQGIETPIMVMNTSPNDFELYHTYHLEPEIYSLSLLLKLKEFLDEKQMYLNIHLEFDTGMNRLGFEENEIEKAIKVVKSSRFIKVKSLYSHMASAEDSTEDSFNRGQLKKFDAISQRLESELRMHTIRHIRNSAGTLRYPDSPTDMVRLGIGLYGIDNNNLFQNKLQTVSTLKTVISQIRTVSKGETVGYNRTFRAAEDMVIATIGIGYADGFKRCFSNGKGSVNIQGQLTPVVGNVNMDMTMVDVTQLEVKEGDEVIIYFDDLSVRTLAKNADTIPYEIFTSIGERVKREYVFEF